MKIYPIGYSTHGSAEYVELLMQKPKMLIIDCRIKPYCSWSAQWCDTSLQARYGVRYRLAGAWLGNAAHERNKANRPRYIGEKPRPNEIELVDPGEGIRGLLYYLRREHDLILLCQCRDYNNCHLSEIVRLLQKRMPDVQVVFHGQESHKQEMEIGYK